MTVGSTFRAMGEAPSTAYANYASVARLTGNVGRASSVMVTTRPSDPQSARKVASALDTHFRDIGLRASSVETTAEERSRQITEALQNLPENQRMALILKKYDDLSYQEISKILGCSVSAVESLLVRAKRNLLEKLMIS